LKEYLFHFKKITNIAHTQNRVKKRELEINKEF